MQSERIIKIGQYMQKLLQTKSGPFGEMDELTGPDSNGPQNNNSWKMQDLVNDRPGHIKGCNKDTV